MPNHITNQIKFFGDPVDIHHVLTLIEGEDRHIDFNKIIHMPDTVYGGELLGSYERKMYGANNWYDWRIAHWGTKWNAYSTGYDADENVLTFDTAWSCPSPIISKLAKICADFGVYFEGKWADENCGFNVGEFVSDKEFGKCYYNFVEDASQEAYSIYVELKGKSCAMHQDENGNWVYHGCDNCPNPCC